MRIGKLAFLERVRMIVRSEHPCWHMADNYAAGVINQYIVTEGEEVDGNFGNTIRIRTRTGFVATIDKHRIVDIDGNRVDFPKPLENIHIKVEGSTSWYDVRRVDGVVTCSCKGFQFRRDCKHLKELDAA